MSGTDETSPIENAVTVTRLAAAEVRVAEARHGPGSERPGERKADDVRGAAARAASAAAIANTPSREPSGAPTGRTARAGIARVRGAPGERRRVGTRSAIAPLSAIPHATATIAVRRRRATRSARARPRSRPRTRAPRSRSRRAPRGRSPPDRRRDVRTAAGTIQRSARRTCLRRLGLDPVSTLRERLRAELAATSERHARPREREREAGGSSRETALVAGACEAAAARRRGSPAPRS